MVLVVISDIRAFGSRSWEANDNLFELHLSIFFYHFFIFFKYFSFRCHYRSARALQYPPSDKQRPCMALNFERSLDHFFRIFRTNMIEFRLFSIVVGDCDDYRWFRWFSTVWLLSVELLTVEYDISIDVQYFPLMIARCHWFSHVYIIYIVVYSAFQANFKLKITSVIFIIYIGDFRA